MNCQVMQNSEWNLITFYQVKETILERLYTIWFHLCDILEKGNGKKSIVPAFLKENGLKHRDFFLGWWNYSLWYSDGGCMTQYIHALYNITSGWINLKLWISLKNHVGDWTSLGWMQTVTENLAALLTHKITSLEVIGGHISDLRNSRNW